MIPAELRETMANMIQDPDFKAGMNILVHDQKSDYQPASSDMQRTADDMEFNLKEIIGKIARIVDKDFKYGFGRMLESYCR